MAQKRRMITIDGNEATASVAHRTNEVIAIYPITPSSNMGEFADEWSANGKKNIWGNTPDVVEMQSEGGAAGAVHGALQAGALTTTFTASQGLLLMIPNMFKIAGELNAHSMHVSGRAVATHALSIFGDHSDVMACRQTGFALLASGSVQEAHDFALVAQAATLKSRVPFLHFFDGFRTSHEVSKIEELSDDDLRFMLDPELIRAHRERALNPDNPKVRGTAQNPDAFFQAREACNPYYLACPDQVRESFKKFGQLTGRNYGLFDYFGAPDAERVIVLMGSGAETAHETVDYLAAKGEKVGIIKVRLYRPFSLDDFIKALPQTTRNIAVLDRTKEPGALGEPLYLDIVQALSEASNKGSWKQPLPRIVGGRYGLSSKEFTPAMIKAVFDEISKSDPKNGFTVGIHDDVTHLSLPWDQELSIESPDTTRCVFFGLGADGTVGANKNSIKIIGEETENYAQGYFVYDSKKSGGITISHLRFGKKPLQSAYLITSANFTACHQFVFLDKYDVLDYAVPGSVFLLNAPYEKDEVWNHLPVEVQQQIIDKQLKFYVIDAYKVARETGMGGRINTVMQTCFFAISGVLQRDEAIDKIKNAIVKTYGRKGEDVVQANFHAVDKTLANLHQIEVPARADSNINRSSQVFLGAPDFVQKVTSMLAANKGDLLPVSAFTDDGTWPLSTTQWEKRSIAQEIPSWDPSLCIQCNKCSFVCPHAAIRPKVYEAEVLEKAPETFKSTDFKGADFRGMKLTIQVAPEDCTGCTICAVNCPGKDKSDPSRKALTMIPQIPVREQERDNFNFFMSIPDVDRTAISRIDVKGSQFFRPLFEFSGACAGCGETPYVKLLTQLFGDRALVANATGCSSIYGGNLPTTPYCTNKDGRGPSWSNSLFEDNAEFGFGFRLAIDNMAKDARQLFKGLASSVGEKLVDELLNSDQGDEAALAAQRERISELRRKLTDLRTDEARRLEAVIDYLVKKSVWILGGDGWAYDIGFGGLDHVIAMNRDVNVLVMDTEVYSNTGGQQSKATPIGASAKFAAAGRELGKKDLGLMAMSYGHAYVARVAFGAKDNHTVQVFREAESYPGTSIIIAYSHCIAHGYDLSKGIEQQKLAVNSGIWPLYRFDPRRAANGEPPLKLDSPAKPTASVAEYMENETRFKTVKKLYPERYERLAKAAAEATARQVCLYQQLSRISCKGDCE